MSGRASLVAFIWLLPVAGVSAQIDDGSIKGFITDVTDARLPRVVVSATGASLMGTRTTVSDEHGYYRLLNLPPGEYQLEARLAGFARFERRDLVVAAGLTIQLDFTMVIGELTEAVEVRGEGPLLEAERAARSFHVDGDFLRALPLGSGHDWWDALRLAPGVLIKSGEGTQAETHGAALSSNVFLVDGIDAGEPFWNQPGFSPLPPDSIAQISITTSGHDAASRMAMGAQLEIVTRSGGNHTHGSATIDLQSKRLNATNVPSGTAADKTITRPAASVGGPLLRDRLWYFGSYRYIRERDGVARSAEEVAILGLFQPDFAPFDSQLRNHQSFAKITYQPTTADQVVFSVQFDRLVRENGALAPQFTRERDATTRSDAPLYQASWRRWFGTRVSMDTQAGFHSMPYQDVPQGSGSSVAVYSNVFSSGGALFGSGRSIAEMGNSQFRTELTQRRSNVSATLRYFPGEWRGSHEFTVGLTLMPQNEYSFLSTSSNNGFILEDRVLVDPANPALGARTFHRRFVSPTTLAGVRKSSRTTRLFAQDSWRPGRRWVVNAGIRIDGAKTFDTWGDSIQSSWQVGPRLGVTYRLTSDGRSIVWGGFNRMHDAIANVLTYSEGALRPERRDEYDVDRDGSFETVITIPAVLERPASSDVNHVSPDLRQPRTDEITLGVSRQLSFKIIAGAMFIQRIYKDRVVGTDTNGVYENGRFLGYRDPAFNQILEIQNGTDNWFLYRALELSAQKSFSRDLQFLVGYTHANQWIDGTWDRNDPASFLQPEAFPNTKGIGSLVRFATAGQVNSLPESQAGLGLLNTGAPPNMFKVNAAYIAPLGFTIGVSHLFQMGQYSGPILTLIPANDVTHPQRVTLSNGRVVSNPLATRVRFFYPTRDERQLQLPSVNVLNLRVGKRFKRGGQTFEGALDVCNVSNRGNNLGFDPPTLSEGQPAAYVLTGTQAPRAGQISFRWEF
jgi:carboxypeptidase family protein/TonB-dependent receptor-like protein